jgi:hypothetical protein
MWLLRQRASEARVAKEEAWVLRMENQLIVVTENLICLTSVFAS